MQPGNFPLGTDVFLQHAHLVRRHKQLVIAAVLNAEVIPAYALYLHGFHAHVLADAVLGMHHVVTYVDFPEAADALLAADPAELFFLPAENILFRHQHQPCPRQLKAVQKRPLHQVDAPRLYLLLRISFYRRQPVPAEKLLQGS